jgi:hypothetical protein
MLARSAFLPSRKGGGAPCLDRSSACDIIGDLYCTLLVARVLDRSLNPLIFVPQTGTSATTGGIVQKDFVESVFCQDLCVGSDLQQYAASHPLICIDHVETSFYESEMDLELARLTLNCIEPFLVEVGKRLRKTGFRLLKIWLQRYRMGAYHPVHIHAPDAFNYSFVLYVDATSDSGRTMFYSVGYPYVDRGSFEVSPKIGRCVLFPGAMPHEALPNRDERRTIVSGNIAYFDRGQFEQASKLDFDIAGRGAADRVSR